MRGFDNNRKMKITAVVIAAAVMIGIFLILLSGYSSISGKFWAWENPSTPKDFIEESASRASTIFIAQNDDKTIFAKKDNTAILGAQSEIRIEYGGVLERMGICEAARKKNSNLRCLTGIKNRGDAVEIAKGSTGSVSYETWKDITTKIRLHD